MSAVVDDVIAFYRLFSSLEREEICCGTVSPAQCVILQTLTDGEWDVSSLASHSRVTKGAMTRLIDGLVQRGWVSRDKAPEDARRVVVALTDCGRNEAARLRELTEQGIAMILEQVPETEREQVVRSIGLLREAAARTRNHLDCC